MAVGINLEESEHPVHTLTPLRWNIFIYRSGLVYSRWKTHHTIIPKFPHALQTTILKHHPHDKLIK